MLELRTRTVPRTALVTSQTTYITLVCVLTLTAGMPVSTAYGGNPGLAVDRYLTKLEGLGFSGAVWLSMGGQTLLREAYGLADRNTGAELTPDTDPT